MPDGQARYKTWLGTFFSVLMLGTLVFYGSLQLQRLYIYGETIVTMAIRDAHYDYNHTISTQDGLKFAYAITHYDNNPEPVDDPRYGNMVARVVRWGFKEELGIDVSGSRGQHRCTQEELGFSEGDGSESEYSKFYQTHANSIRDTKFY